MKLGGAIVAFALFARAGLAAADAAAEQKACDGGAPKAFATLAVRYIQGDGVSKDFAKSKQLALKACSSKVARGCGIAGMIGYAENTDAPRAMALLQQGCTLGDGEACNYLGALWAEGKPGTTGADLAKSSKLYVRACTLEDGTGCFNAGNVYRLGEGAKIDLATAVKYYQRSCDLNNASGCVELGTAYGNGDGVKKDTKKTLELYRKACRLGSQAACETLGAAK